MERSEKKKGGCALMMDEPFFCFIAGELIIRAISSTYLSSIPFNSLFYRMRTNTLCIRKAQGMYTGWWTEGLGNSLIS